MFYPIPNHRLTPFNVALDLPETERAAAECLSLPVRPSLSADDLDRIVTAVNALAVRGRLRHGEPPRRADRPRHDGSPPRQGVGRRLDGVDLVAVADPAGDPFPPRSRGANPILDGQVKGIVDTGVDYCMVAVPTAFHEEIGLALAEAGVHALVEKPLAQNLPNRPGISPTPSPPRSWFGGRRAHRALQPGPPVRSARVAHRQRRSRRGSTRSPPAGRVHYPNRIADVGVIFDLATHDIDLTAWVTRKRYTSIAAYTAKRSGRPHEDLVAMIGRLEGGTVTDHLVNWLSPLKERVTTITGERGAYVANTLNAELTFYANGANVNTWKTWPSSAGSARAT